MSAEETIKKARDLERAVKAKRKALEKAAGGAVAAKVRAREHSALMARRSREDNAQGAEIGELPAVVDAVRKESCRLDLERFLVTYFPHSTGLSPFSPDHKRLTGDMQRLILEGGRRVNAVYREFAKTTISENTIIWAALYGHSLFGLITGVNKSASAANIDAIKTELAENDLLLADFPEVCYPIQQGNFQQKPQRAKSQTYLGEYTNAIWRADEIVLPTIAGSAASGARIVAKPFAKARGVKYKRQDGTNQRPDLILIDDPQDNESAASSAQVKKNLDIIRKGLIHATSHTRKSSIIVNGTVIAANDMIEQLLCDPAWEGERVKFIRSWSAAHDSFWLKDYANVRRAFDRTIAGDLRRAQREATALYLANREVADEGAVVSWEYRYTKPFEVSAIQHAYNVLIDDGPEVFASEYQNEPIDERARNSKLTAALVASKTNGLAKGRVPKGSSVLTSYVDVHLGLLYYVVCAWKDDFTGAVIDYGTYPRQPIAYFSQAAAPTTMKDVAGQEMSEDAWIQAGLTKTFDYLLNARYQREDGAELQINRALVDAHWAEKTELVHAFCRRHPRYPATVFPAHGYGSSATRPPLNAMKLKPGARQGPGWRINPIEPGSRDQWLTIDANHWKNFVCGRLAMPLASPGGIELFGLDPREHSLFADHCVSEIPIDVEAKSEKFTARITIWEWPLPHQDNHYWDCLCGCAGAASMVGISVPGLQRGSPDEKPRSMREMREEALRGRRAG